MPTASGKDWDIRLVRDLPVPAMKKAARLVQSALPGYYETLTPTIADSLVCADFVEDHGELERCLGALKSSEVCGILSTYDMEELPERQYRSFQLVARTLTREDFTSFAENVRRLRRGLPSITGHGTYLAFIAVDPSERGTGLADRLMLRAIETAGSNPLFLTVRNDNHRARAFYARHGFVAVAEGQDFGLLRRSSRKPEASGHS